MTNRPVVDVTSLLPCSISSGHPASPPRPFCPTAGPDRRAEPNPQNRVLALSDYFSDLRTDGAPDRRRDVRISMRPLMVGTSEFVQAQLRACRTLAEVMEIIAKSYNVIHGHRYNHVQKKGGLVSFTIDDREFPYTMDHNDAFVVLSAECLLVYVHALMLSLPARTGRSPCAPSAPAAMASRGGSTHLSFWGIRCGPRPCVLPPI